MNTGYTQCGRTRKSPGRNSWRMAVRRTAAAMGQRRSAWGPAWPLTSSAIGGSMAARSNRPSRLLLSEREHVSLGARLEERDLYRALADRVVLTEKLVQPAIDEEPVAVLVDILAVR